MISLCLVLASVASTVCLPTRVSSELLPVSLGGRSGYVSADGEVAIPFRFRAARRFHEGLAAVRRGSNWSFIGPDGKIVIEGPFWEARDFHGGFAAVREPGEGHRRWSLVDREGHRLGGEEGYWDEVGDFSEGLAAFRSGGLAGYLDTEGRVILPQRFSASLPSAFIGGLAATSSTRIGVGVDTEVVSIAIDREGRTLFEQEGILTRFPGGYLHRPDRSAQRLRLLDEGGRPLHEGWFDDVAFPTGPGAVAVRRDGRWGWLDPDGSLRMPETIRAAGCFCGGLAAAQNAETGAWGYVDAQGDWVIFPCFAKAGDFDRGFAAVRILSSVGWVSESGDIVWNPLNVPAADWEREAARGREGAVLAEYRKFDDDDPQSLTVGKLVDVFPLRQQALERSRVNGGDEVLIRPGSDDRIWVYSIDLPVGSFQLEEIQERFTLVRADYEAEQAYRRDGDLDGALRESNTFWLRNEARLQQILERDLPDYAGRLRVDVPSYLDVTPGSDPERTELHSIGTSDELPANLRESDPIPWEVFGEGFEYRDPESLELAFPGRFSDARPFSEGLAAVCRDGRYGFVDRTGTLRIEPRFANTAAFSEGLCLVSDPETGLLGFVDQEGAMALPFQFQEVASFHEGRARIQVQGATGFIDRSGKVVIPATLERAGDFASALAPFLREGRWGYLDREGKIVVEPAYLFARTHVEGMAFVITEEQTPQFIDESGEVVIENFGNFATDFLDGVALAGYPNLGMWDLIDRQGGVVAQVVPQE